MCSISFVSLVPSYLACSALRGMVNQPSFSPHIAKSAFVNKLVPRCSWLPSAYVCISIYTVPPLSFLSSASNVLPSSIAVIRSASLSLSNTLSVCLSPSVCVSLFVCVSLCVSACVCVFLSICVSVSSPSLYLCLFVIWSDSAVASAQGIVLALCSKSLVNDD